MQVDNIMCLCKGLSGGWDELAGITPSGGSEDEILLLLDADESSAGMLCPARCPASGKPWTSASWSLQESGALIFFFSLDEARQ